MTTNTTQETPEISYELVREFYIQMHYGVGSFKEFIEKDLFLDAADYEQICYDYHNENIRVEQSQPVKSLQECKEEVFKKHYPDEEADIYFDTSTFNKLFDIHDEAAELYANQFRKVEKTITDEEIQNIADEKEYHFHFNIGAKWMRDKLLNNR